VAIFFAAFLQTAIVAPILHLLFHNRWNESILLSQILSIGLAFDAVGWVSAALVSARGDFKLNLVFMLFAVPGFFGLVSLGALLGQALGVATGVGIYYAIIGPCYAYVAMRDAGAISVLRLYALPLMLAALAVGAGYVLAHFLFGRNLVIPQVVSMLVLASAFYAGLVRLCMPDTFSDIRAQAASVLSKLRQ
jgi:O-antigen/teichoic acid export membrane protein